MKFTKILALMLAALMSVFALASCDSGSDGSETTAADIQETKEVIITVSMQVKDLNGNVVYDIPQYVYSGKAPTPIELIDDYFYMESDTETVEYDEYDTLISIGSVEAGEATNSSGETVTTYWWWTLNGKESNSDLGEYIVQDKDAMVFYLREASNTAK